MHPTVCYNQATTRVAFIEAPEAFLQVLLELGTCNLTALTALLEADVESEDAAQRPSSGGAPCTRDGDTPLAKLSSSLGSPGTIPEPVTQAQLKRMQLGAVRPGPALRRLLLSAVGALLPGSQEAKVSKALKCCNLGEGTPILHLFPATLGLCPVCWAPDLRLLGYVLFVVGLLVGVAFDPPPCPPEFVKFTPLLDEGHQDLNSGLPVYSCDSCNLCSNHPLTLCPGCSKLMDTEVGMVNAAGAATHKTSSTPCFLKPRKTGAVVPVVRRGKEEKLCLLSDGMQLLHPHSVTGVLETLRHSGVLHRSEEITSVSIALGCREVLSLARLVRVPGHEHVFSDAFAEVLASHESKQI